MRKSFVLVLALIGCGKSDPPPKPAPAPAPAPVAAPAPAPDAAPAAVAAPAPDAAPAPLVPSKTWPFHEWDRAEAVTFNHVPPGPDVQLFAYNADGWTPNLLEQKPIELEQGKRAVEWVIATRGTVEVSKCPFPRHAVVLYSGSTPVASINLCFECGDLLVWPEFEPGPDWDRYDDWTKAEHAKFDKLTKKKHAAYEKLYPEWEAFFRDELGFSITPPKWR